MEDLVHPDESIFNSNGEKVAVRADNRFYSPNCLQIAVGTCSFSVLGETKLGWPTPLAKSGS